MIQTKKIQHSLLTLLLPTVISLYGCDSEGVYTGGDVLSADSGTDQVGLVVGDDLFPEIVNADPNSYAVPDYGDDPYGPADLTTGASLRAAPNANVVGTWSNTFAWPLSAIHAALLPNGSVLTYGTNGPSSVGGGGRGFDVDRWTPSQGTGPGSHLTTPSSIDTNIFCSAQMVLSDDNVLITGGDAQVNGQDTDIRNFGVNATSLYNPISNQLTEARPMNFARWYPTIVTLGGGQQLVLGGRSSIETNNHSRLVPSIPELYDPRTGRYRLLRGAQSDSYYSSSWWYPRAFLNVRGRVIMFRERSNEIYELNPRRGGSFRRVMNMPAAFGNFGASLPAVKYENGRVMVISETGRTGLVNINANPPRVSMASTAPTGARYWSDATVLPDGKVLITGGGTTRQQLATAVHEAAIWDPRTDTWQMTEAANGRRARLYHSTSILLPDASVLVAGGGPPGPITNLNANIYYPPYLYGDNGALATRPRIIAFGGMIRGGNTRIQVRDTDTISSVALVKAGSVTHSFDQAQRFRSIRFTQNGNRVVARIPRSKNQHPPGLYMLFVINDKGVPSLARLEMLD